MIDGEVIALDDDGRPSFNILQNYGSSKAPVLYFVFDVMVLAGRDEMREPQGVPVRESPGSEERSMGRGADGGENEGLSSQHPTRGPPATWARDGQ